MTTLAPPPIDPMLRGLRGRGLEIGAFHSPLAVPPAASVTYVDVLPSAVARRFFPEVGDEIAIVEPEILCPADNLRPIPSGSQDFVLASHLLEHIRDPIQALLEWHRVLRLGGTLFLRLPDMRATFDARRGRTTLSHLVLDHALRDDIAASAARDLDHFVEWARVVNDLTDSRQVRFWAALLARIGYPIHFHCWVPEDIQELLGHVAEREGAAFALEEASQRPDGYEFTFLLHKAI